MVSEPVTNLSEILSSLSPNILENISLLINLLRAIGIVFILYIIYTIINGIINWKRYKHLKEIEKKMAEMDKKLDRILKNKKIKK